MGPQQGESNIHSIHSAANASTNFLEHINISETYASCITCISKQGGGTNVNAT
jgi:hypothetical protein